MSDTEYTIYLVNESAKTQVFWCFLAPPKELASDPDVYANSSTSLAVDPNASSINTFTIPVQYVVEAGASTRPVGPNIKISSTCKENVELRDIWDVEYATVPPRKGPKMTKSDEKAEDDKIKITSNDFDQIKNETDGWFSSMSFGIKTDQGFIGMTWAPGPQEDKTLTPVLKFYVATGTFEDNELAKWTTVSKTCAEINVPRDFKYNKTTVTLTSKGHWEVNPGALPKTAFSPAHSGPLAILIETQRLLS